MARVDDRAPGRSPLVLIVEDDAEMRRFYIAAFASDGFRTDHAHNGFQAFEKALNESPDVILTDIAVPGMDGIELCRRLRADERTQAVPVLAITGYGDRQYADRIIGAGADHVLTKPCPGEVLVEEARRLMQTRPPHQGAPHDTHQGTPNEAPLTDAHRTPHGRTSPVAPTHVAPRTAKA